MNKLLNTGKKNNVFFKIGVFPGWLKTTKVTPIDKKSSKLEVLNYRRISLLSNLH